MHMHIYTAGSPHRMTYCPCPKFVESLPVCIGRTKAQTGCRRSQESEHCKTPNNRTRHKEAARMLGSPRLCSPAPHTQYHRSFRCPAPVGTPGDQQRHSQATDDGSIPHKGPPGNAEGSWDPGGAQVAPQPNLETSQRMSSSCKGVHSTEQILKSW